MLNFIYVNPALINPKTKENIREQEIKKLSQLKEEGYTLIGLEMTVPELSKFCDLNIDPQHTDQKTQQSCVKEICLNHQELFAPLTPLKDKKVIFLTNRVDLDSISSYIVANNIINNHDVTYNEFLKQINAHDTFQTLPWQKQKDIEEGFDPNSSTKALASTIKPFMITQQNIEDVTTFIKEGLVSDQTMANYRQTQMRIINAVKENEIKVNKKKGFVVVETTLPCATDVGYCYAPIVVAINPSMRAQDGSTYRKISICQHEEGFADLKEIKSILSSKEQGWGGSPTFIGSPQGTSSEISLEEIQKIISKNLTKEYNQKLSSYTPPSSSFEK